MKYRTRMEKGKIKNIQIKKEFNGEIVSREYVEKAFEFSYKMAFGNGFHRITRSGGSHIREAYEVFINTFRGKIAEQVVNDYFEKRGRNVNGVDFSIMGAGDWDMADLFVDNISISIKSTKHFGQLLLLEVKDWDEAGNYIPNLKHKTHHKYDYFVLVRIELEVSDNQHEAITYEELKNLLFSKTIRSEISGVLSYNDFVNQIIHYKYIIKKGDLLNGKLEMDADNYYVHAAELESIELI